MPSKNKNTNSSVKSNPGITVSPSVGNYEKHPFFVKKATAAKALLLEVGLPKELSSKVRR